MMTPTLFWFPGLNGFGHHFENLILFSFFPINEELMMIFQKFVISLVFFEGPMTHTNSIYPFLPILFRFLLPFFNDWKWFPSLCCYIFDLKIQGCGEGQAVLGALFFRQGSEQSLISNLIVESVMDFVLFLLQHSDYKENSQNIFQQNFIRFAQINFFLNQAHRLWIIKYHNNTMNQPKIHPQSHQRNEEPKEPPRKNLNAFLFILLMLNLQLYTWNNFLLMNVQSAFPALFIVQLSIGYPLAIFISCWMAKSKGEILYLYFLFDSILVSYVAVCIGLAGFFYLFSQDIRKNPQLSTGDIVSFFLLPGLSLILFFLMLGTLRILLVNLRWKKWHIILFKFNLLLSEVATFIGFGDIIIFKTNMPQALKEFTFAFVFAMFATNFQLFGRISALDGTDALKYQYEAVSDQEVNERMHEETQEHL